jgi:hypothetical protein
MAPGNAVSQSLAPPDMRAFTSAVFVLVVSLVGLGFGPTVVGVLSDTFAGAFGLGEASLRYALPTVVIPAIAASALFWRASVHLGREMAPLHEAPEAATEPVEPAAILPVGR